MHNTDYFCQCDVYQVVGFAKNQKKKTVHSKKMSTISSNFLDNILYRKMHYPWPKRLCNYSFDFNILNISLAWVLKVLVVHYFNSSFISLFWGMHQFLQSKIEWMTEWMYDCRHIILYKNKLFLSEFHHIFIISISFSNKMKKKNPDTSL